MKWSAGDVAKVVCALALLCFAASALVVAFKWPPAAQAATTPVPRSGEYGMSLSTSSSGGGASLLMVMWNTSNPKENQVHQYVGDKWYALPKVPVK